jgi:hypothetical protein
MRSDNMDARTITLWTTDDRNVYFEFGTNILVRPLVLFDISDEADCHGTLRTAHRRIP